MHTHPPSPPLDDYIDQLYYVDDRMPYRREKIMPTAALDLKFNFGGSIQAFEEGHAEPFVECSESWSMGLRSTCHAVEWPADIRFFGVAFKPGGAYPFLRVPLSELRNRVVPLDAIWGRFAGEVRERLYAAPTIQARFALLDRLLLSRLGGAPSGLNVVRYAIEQISRRRGALSMRALSGLVGISQNHLNTQFKRFVGGTPKALARLFRFQHVRRCIDHAQPLDWTRMAHESLYYDQSHFNKDFMAFTGHTPTEYLRLRQRVHTENPQHAHLLRLLPN